MRNLLRAAVPVLTVSMLTACGGGGGAGSSSSSSAHPSAGSAPEATTTTIPTAAVPSTSGSVQAVPSLDKTTTDVADATKAEQRAKRPTLRLPRGDGWTDMPAGRFPGAFDKVWKPSAADAEGIAPVITASALNTDFPYAQPGEKTLYCEEPQMAEGVTDVKVLDNQPVQRGDQKGCRTLVEFTSTDGYRMRSGVLSFPVRNRLGNRAMVAVEAMAPAKIYDKVAPDMDRVFQGISVTP